MLPGFSIHCCKNYIFCCIYIYNKKYSLWGGSPGQPPLLSHGSWYTYIYKEPCESHIYIYIRSRVKVEVAVLGSHPINYIFCAHKAILQQQQQHTHTHTHKYIFIYISIYMCVCVYIYILTTKWKQLCVTPCQTGWRAIFRSSQVTCADLARHSVWDGIIYFISTWKN